MRAPRRRFAKTMGAAVITLGAALTFVACEAKVPTAAEVAAMDVASAERNASEAGFMRTPSGDRTDFFVDGVRVSAERARALEARQIGSITVVKSERSTGRDTIFVVTASRLSEEEKRARASRGPDPFEDAERTYESPRTKSDSTEHIVAHIERERERMRADAGSPSVARPTLRSPGDKLSTITIDGKIASEAQLAALDERDIASIAVYKGKEGQLLLRSDGKEHLEATSGPLAKSAADDSEALIAVTTKMARRAQSKKP